MNDTNLWLSLGGMAAVLSMLGAFGLWLLRQVIREELKTVKDDIQVLRAAVFNHLSHGEQPDEHAIREALGL